MTEARRRNSRGSGPELRRELLDAAIEALLEPQPLPLPSLRAIARKCGVSASAVYMHFPSQDALELTIATELFEQLRQHLDAGDIYGAPPRERLYALTTAFVGWALKHPGAYQMLFERADPHVESGTGPGLDLLDRVADLLQTGDDAARRLIAMRIWAGLHGVASLHIHKQSAPWQETPLDAAWSIVASQFDSAQNQRLG